MGYACSSWLFLLLAWLFPAMVWGAEAAHFYHVGAEALVTLPLPGKQEPRTVGVEYREVPESRLLL